MKRLFTLLFLLVASFSWAAAPSRLATYTSGAAISSTDVTRNEDAIFNYLQSGVEVIADSAVVNADVSASAAISASKLNLTSISQNITLTGTFALTGGMTMADTYLLDLSSINASASTEGLKLPQNTACTGATAEGQVCWDTDGDELRIGNGTSAEEIFLQAFVGNTSRDTTTASGTQAITGVGFKPRAVYFQVIQDNSDEWSLGIDTATNSMALFHNGGVSADTWRVIDDSSASIYIIESTGNVYAGEISSLDSDGFTITWTKTGTPTGTIAVDFMAFR